VVGVDKMVISAIWRRVKQWCVERWELLIGFFAGIFALLLFLKRDNVKTVLDKKNSVQEDITKAEARAREELEEEWNSNIDEFLTRNSKIEEEHKQKLREVEDDKKDRVKELMSSDKPEQEIAEALAKLLK
jgi:hypothetical protein